MILFSFNEELSFFNSKLDTVIELSKVEAEMWDLSEADVDMLFSWVCILSFDFHCFECNDSELSSFSVKITCR